jgi:hypothetical protein
MANERRRNARLSAANLRQTPEKEQRMKRITGISLFASSLAGLAAVAVFGLPDDVKTAGDRNTFTLDLACDCRTGSKGFLSGTPDREDVFIISGKLFPAGTLPSGECATGKEPSCVDPTQPGSIGDWTCRGQHGFPFPPEVASAYSASPPIFNTQYFILNERGGFTLEGWVKPDSTGELLSITGGIGSLSGAAGFVEQAPIGTNRTGCPNVRTTFHFRRTIFNFHPGSMEGGDSQ